MKFGIVIYISDKNKKVKPQIKSIDPKDFFAMAKSSKSAKKKTQSVLQDTDDTDIIERKYNSAVHQTASPIPQEQKPPATQKQQQQQQSSTSLPTPAASYPMTSIEAIGSSSSSGTKSKSSCSVEQKTPAAFVDNAAMIEQSLSEKKSAQNIMSAFKIDKKSSGSSSSSSKNVSANSSSSKTTTSLRAEG